MPQSNGRIYRTAAAGISTGDIAYVLGSSSSDVGTLCQHDSINKWAKFKPVRHAKWGELSLADRSFASFGFATSPTYWEGDEQKRGIFANTFSDVYNASVVNQGEWNYLRPRGISQFEPYRMLDFDEYKTSAYTGGGQNPIAVCPITTDGPWNALYVHNRSYAEIQVNDVHSNADFNYFKNDAQFNAAKVYLLYKIGNAPVKILECYYLDEFQERHQATFADIIAGKDVRYLSSVSLAGRKVVMVLSNCPSVSSLDPTYPESDDSYEWMYLPGAYKEIPTESMTLAWGATLFIDYGSYGEKCIYIDCTLTNRYMGTMSRVSVTVDQVTIHGRESSETIIHSDPMMDSFGALPGHSSYHKTEDLIFGPNFDEGEILDITINYHYEKVSSTHSETVYGTEHLERTYHFD